MNISDFFSTETTSTSDSKGGLFNFMCPFDVDYDDTTKVATIKSAGRDIYFVGWEMYHNGSAVVELGFLKKKSDGSEKELTFKHFINDWEGKSEGIQKAIGMSVLNLVQAFLGRKLDLKGADNFSFTTFEEFCKGLFTKLTPRTTKSFVALEFSKDENNYINYRIANLSDTEEGTKKYFPSFSSKEEDIRIDLLYRSQMTYLTNDEPSETTDEVEELLTASDDSLESLLL